MAKHFSQEEIDRFREAFSLYAQQGTLLSDGHLRFIMRSLGFSPTVEETKKYYLAKDEKVDFATFLDIVYEHSNKEMPFSEILTAFRAHDKQKRGLMSARELRSILMGMGERLTAQEVDMVFQEANIPANGMVSYEDFLKILSTPLPDY